jgi:hypothetical protein
MVEAERALGRARVECDAIHDQATTVRVDYWARVCVSTAS